MTMNAVANYGVICYFFCALYFYERKKYVGAVLFQALCIGSNANGLMAATLLLAAYSLHLFDRKKTQSESKRWLICLVTNVILIPCYFINYKVVTLPNALPFDAGRDLVFLIRMAGAPISFDLSLFYGLLVFAGVFFLFPYRKALASSLLPLTIILVFAAGTMVLAAIYRAGYADAQFQTSRYLLYPQMLLGVLGFCVWRRLDGNLNIRFLRFSVPAVFWLIYLGNYAFGDAGFVRTEARAQTRQFWYPAPARSVRICAESCSQDIYCIDENREYVQPRYYIIPRYRVSH
jgi:hypothetical protein